MNLIHLTSQCKPVKSAFPGSIQEILRIQHKLLHSAIQKKSQQTAMSHLPYLLLNPRQHVIIHRLHIKIRCRPYPPQKQAKQNHSDDDSQSPHFHRHTFSASHPVQGMQNSQNRKNQNSQQNSRRLRCRNHRQCQHIKHRKAPIPKPAPVQIQKQYHHKQEKRQLIRIIKGSLIANRTPVFPEDTSAPRQIYQQLHSDIHLNHTINPGQKSFSAIFRQIAETPDSTGIEDPKASILRKFTTTKTNPIICINHQNKCQKHIKQSFCLQLKKTFRSSSHTVT